MKLKFRLMVVCAICAVILTAVPAGAATLGVDFSSPGVQNSQSVWSLGYQFVANNAVSVVALGTFDYLQDGLVGPQQVGLWDASHTLLASTFVDNSDPLQGFWRFNAISPISLVAGATYYVAAQGGEGYTWLTSGFTVDPNITFVQDAWHYNGDTSNNPLAFPDTTDNLQGFFGGNIELSSASTTPEPSSFALFGLGMAVVGLVRRRLSR
jgi:hypothetical protein